MAICYFRFKGLMFVIGEIPLIIFLSNAFVRRLTKEKSDEANLITPFIT